MNSTVQLQVESAEGFRISPQQRRLWGLMERYPRVSFAAQCHVRIIGPLNVDRLDKAILSLRRMHEILRTRFVLLPGTRVPVQVIGDDLTGLDQRFDLKNRSCAGVKSEVESIADSLWKQAGRTEDPGMDFTLVHVTDQEYVLLVTSSGLCADAPALAAIVREVRDAYSGNASMDSSLQYADISEWQNQLLESDAREHDSYWKAPDFSTLRFAHLPFEHRNSESADFSPGVLLRHFPAKPAAWLPATERTSGEAVLIAAYQVLISRLTSLDQFLVGVRVDGRTPAELRDAIGLFAKSMPVAAALEQDQSFVELVQKVSRALELATYDQAFFDAETLGSPESSQRCHTPLVLSACLVLELAPVESTEWEITSLEECLEPFELAVTANISDGSLKTLKFAWDKSIFDEQEIALLADFYTNLLHQIASDPNQPLSHFHLDPDVVLPLLTAKAIEENVPGGVHSWIEDQCARVPQRIAAICGDQQITYAELNQRASLLARQLLKLGAAPDTVIAIVAQRSIDFIVAILAVLYSRAGHPPLIPGVLQGF